MRLPRFRLRTLMVAVAIAAVVLGTCIERHRRFSRIAAHHRAELGKHLGRLKRVSFRDDDPDMIRLEWRWGMMSKYERAARHPWLPRRARPGVNEQN